MIFLKNFVIKYQDIIIVSQPAYFLRRISAHITE